MKNSELIFIKFHPLKNDFYLLERMKNGDYHKNSKLFIRDLIASVYVCVWSNQEKYT